MLTREQRQKWADALRSGKYKQARTTLVADKAGMTILGFDRNGVGCTIEGTPDSYCCLGVLVHCLMPEALAEGTHHERGHPYPQNLGIDLGEAIESRFIEANDTMKRSFAEIADMVDNLPTSD